MCEHCKVVYSFFFGVQYHKADCPVFECSRSTFTECSWCGDKDCSDKTLPQGCWDNPGRIAYDGE